METCDGDLIVHFTDFWNVPWQIGMQRCISPYPIALCQGTRSNSSRRIHEIIITIWWDVISGWSYVEYNYINNQNASITKS